MNKNTPFSNPLNVKFQKQENNQIFVTKRYKLDLNDAVVIKDENDKLITINDLKEKDLLEITLTATIPYSVLNIKILPTPQETKITEK